MISLRYNSSHFWGNDLYFLPLFDGMGKVVPSCESYSHIDYLILLFVCSQIKAFLNQRMLELTNGETSSLQHQVQAVAPFVLQQYTSDAIHKMLSDVSSAISLLTNRRTRDLVMILNSKRYYRTY